MSRNKKNKATDFSGFSYRLDPNLDESLRRAVSDALSKMTTLEPGAPITYSINIRVDENGVPGALQPQGNGIAGVQKEIHPADARNPLIEVFEREKSITVIAEVAGVDRKRLRVRATPMALELCSASNGRAVDCMNVINLPNETDPSSAVARYRNGVLEVTVRKGKGRAARTVRVE